MPKTLNTVDIKVKDPNTGNFIPITLLNTDTLSSIDDAKNAAIDAIELKGQTTIASIPDDYTALSNEVDDVKTQIENSALEKLDIDAAELPTKKFAIDPDGTYKRSASHFASGEYKLDGLLFRKISITANNNRQAVVTFCKKAVPESITPDTNIANEYLANGETGSRTVDTGTTEILTIPKDTTYIYILINRWATTDSTPTATTIYTDIQNKIKELDATDQALDQTLDDLEDAIEQKMDSTFALDIDWAGTFGTESYPLGWTTGYYNGSGATGNSNDYIRTYRSSYYTARQGETALVFTAPVGYHACIIEYDENGANGTRHGDLSSGSNVCEVEVTPGYQYKCCLGKFDDDANDYLTSAFIATLNLKVKKTFISWQQEQDARIDALTGGSDIPEYFTSGGYLQGKIDDITMISKNLSANSDSFLFITDYHNRTNRGHSYALIKEVANKTGIQKLFFAGDSGGRTGNASTGYVDSMQKSAQVWSELAKCTEHFYGALGNHEWIDKLDNGGYGIGAMFGNFLNRFKQQVPAMAEKGSYYIEDPVNKIRYYFLHDGWVPSPIDFAWFGDTLEQIGNGWYIAIIAHNGYIPGTASEDEYDGVVIDTTTASHIYARALLEILDAYRNHEAYSTRIARQDYAWDFTGKSGGGAIGVFCGHYHHGTLFAIDDAENEWGVPVWRGSTDSMQAGAVYEEYPGLGNVPWYWANGVIGGTKVVRAPGTTDEQCFYAVQIDLTAKKVYITAIGGDHDWEFSFN